MITGLRKALAADFTRQNGLDVVNSLGAILNNDFSG
jgi:hypothetical protein